MKNAHAWLINVSLLFGTVIVFFAVAETGVRLSGLVKMHDYTPPIYSAAENPELSYVLRPGISEYAFRNTVTTNSLGFRSPELDAAKPVIALLGDSITFGYGVSDTETLAANLQQDFPRFNVLNAGVPGYHIGQELALYREKIASLHPAVVVLIFYWNDFDTETSWLDDEGIMRAEGWKPQEQTCTPITTGILGLLPGKCWLDTHSAFYKGIKQYVNTRSAIEQRDAKREKEKATPSEGVSDDKLERYEGALQQLSALIPVETVKLFVIWPDSSLHEHARPVLRKIAEQNGFHVVDLYDAFGNTMETLSWDYIHPSAQSIREAAEIIYDALRPFFTE